MIFVIDDDETMAKCVARACGEKTKTQIFTNAIEAMNEIARGVMPDLIFLDVLLDGPDGFSFLHEMVSYTDTVSIPVVVVSTLDFRGKDLSQYGVVGILDKTEMTPSEIRKYAKKYAG